MKIIEALKEIKAIYKKIDDLKLKVASHSADLDIETPVYPDQKRQISEWMQAIGDLVKSAGNLSYRLQKTNILTVVTIEIGSKSITKSISEWILRRKKLVDIEKSAWACLTDRNLKPQKLNQTNGAQTDVKVRRHYDAIEKDARMTILESEPHLIDGKLEIINATTDLI